MHTFRSKKYRLFVIICVVATVLLPVYYIGLTANKKYSVKSKETMIASYNVLTRRNLIMVVKNATESTNVKVKFGADICPNLMKSTETETLYRSRYWQAHREGKEALVVYSAFFDDRPIVGSNPWVRILGVRRLSNTPLYCYVWYIANDTPFVVNAEIVRTGANQTIKGGKVYSQNLFSCRLNSSAVPTHVSLATRLCSKSTIYLPVVHSKPSSTWKHNFGVCLEVNFGYFPPELIVEWMELHSMLGVTTVNLYNGSVDSRLDRVFDYYIKKGFLDFRQMPPAVDDPSIQGIRLGSPASLNDCMMRNMYTHRFIVVVDLDEIIIPRLDENYLDLIHRTDISLNLSHSHHTYSFRNTFFFTYFLEDQTQPSFLKTLRLRHRAQPSSYLFRAKSILDPRRCKSVYNHYCWVRFDETGDLSVDVDHTFGRSHHYRSKCPFGKDQCDSYDREKIVDDVMLRFKPRLVERVSKVLSEIGIQ